MGAKGDLQKQHAILILASLWDKERDLPEQSRGNGFRLIEKSERIIRARFPEISRWHHASIEALPINITKYVYSGKMLVPEDYRDLMYIAAVEFALTVANWQLIEYLTGR